jgi:hypothetical protein
MKILGFNKNLMSLAVVANIRLMVLRFCQVAEAPARCHMRF